MAESAKTGVEAFTLRRAFGTDVKVGFVVTLVVTLLGMLASVVSLLATDGTLDKGVQQKMIIVGGVLSLVANALSSVTGYYTPTPGSLPAPPSDAKV